MCACMSKLGDVVMYIEIVHMHVLCVIIRVDCYICTDIEKAHVHVGGNCNQ